MAKTEVKAAPSVDKQREEQIKPLVYTGLLFFACFIAYLTLGILFSVELSDSKDFYFFRNIKIASFVLCGISFFYAVLIFGVKDKERKNEKHKVSESIGCIQGFLWIVFTLFVISLLILGGFISHANPFSKCFNNGTHKYPEKGDPSELCLEQFSGHIVAFICFFVFFFVSLMYACNVVYQKTDKLLTPKKPSEKESIESLERLKWLGAAFFLCFVAFLTLGILYEIQLSKYSDELGFHQKIQIAGFILAILCFAMAFSICMGNLNEKRGKRKRAIEWSGVSCFVLALTFFGGITIGGTFIGNFVSHTDVWNKTCSERNIGNTESPCFYEFKDHTIAFIVLFVIFICAVLCACSCNNEKKPAESNKVASPPKTKETKPPTTKKKETQPPPQKKKETQPPQEKKKDSQPHPKKKETQPPSTKENETHHPSTKTQETQTVLRNEFSDDSHQRKIVDANMEATQMTEYSKNLGHEKRWIEQEGIIKGRNNTDPSTGATILTINVRPEVHFIPPPQSSAGITAYNTQSEVYFIPPPPPSSANHTFQSQGLYSRDDMDQTPPPLAVVHDQSLFERRGVPLPRNESVVEIPNEPPPPYEKASKY